MCHKPGTPRFPSSDKSPQTALCGHIVATGHLLQLVERRARATREAAQAFTASRSMRLSQLPVPVFLCLSVVQFDFVEVWTASSRSLVVVHIDRREVPPVVEGVQAVPGRPRMVPLNWSVSPDEKVTGYEIWRRGGEGDGFVRIAKLRGRDTVTHTDRGERRWKSLLAAQDDGLGSLADDSEYYYKVRAFSSVYALSQWSQVVAAKTKACPSPPVGIKASRGLHEKIRVEWSCNSESDVAEYVVETGRGPSKSFREIGVIAGSQGAKAVWFDHEELRDGHTGYYRVKARDVDGLESQASEAIMGQAGYGEGNTGPAGD